MGTIYREQGATVHVYANDHLPPHFHIVTADEEALVLLGEMAVDKGSAKSAAARAALAWAVANRAALVAEWNRVNPRFPTI